MRETLWELLQEKPENLTCDECFAVMEYYSELLMQGGRALLPEVKRHLAGCPSCQVECRAALSRLVEESGRKARPARTSQVTRTKKEGDRE